MTDTEILYQLFKPSVRLSTSINGRGHNEVILVEPSQESSDIKICRLPHDAIVVNVDKFEGPNHVFNCNTGVCKRADYAIISESYRSILYIELKSGSCLHADVVNQLTGAKCFIRYCREIVHQYWNNTNFMDGYSERFVSFVNISAAQRPICKSSTPIHDSPSKYMKIKSPDRGFQHFNKLVGFAQ
jgi:hypothetical protein